MENFLIISKWIIYIIVAYFLYIKTLPRHQCLSDAILTLKRIKRDFERETGHIFPEEIYDLTKRILKNTRKSLVGMEISRELLINRIIADITFKTMGTEGTHVYRGVLSGYGQTINILFNRAVDCLEREKDYKAPFSAEEDRRAMRERIDTWG